MAAKSFMVRSNCGTLERFQSRQLSDGLVDGRESSPDAAIHIVDRRVIEGESSKAESCKAWRWPNGPIAIA